MSRKEQERLAEAVRRVEEMITHGAKIRGLALPPDFSIERARNIVAGLLDLFEDAFDEGHDIGRLAARGELVGDPDPTEGFA